MMCILNILVVIGQKTLKIWNNYSTIGKRKFWSETNERGRQQKFTARVSLRGYEK